MMMKTEAYEHYLMQGLCRMRFSGNNEFETEFKIWSVQLLTGINWSVQPCLYSTHICINDIIDMESWIYIELCILWFQKQMITIQIKGRWKLTTISIHKSRISIFNCYYVFICTFQSNKLWHTYYVYRTSIVWD